MKLARTVLALWMCLIFLSSGLQSLTSCVAPDGHVCIKFKESGLSAKLCRSSHKDSHSCESQGISQPSSERCCYKCVDIPIAGSKIPDCTVCQLNVTEISKARMAARLNGTSLLCSRRLAATAFGSSRPMLRTMACPDRTVVLRI